MNTKQILAPHRTLQRLRAWHRAGTINHEDYHPWKVALTGMRWNIFVPWLREMDDLQCSNLFFAVEVSRA
jgi:hypothetical protein